MKATYMTATNLPPRPWNALRNHAPRRLAPLVRVACALWAALVIAGCGTLMDMGGSDRVNPRRVYLNDPAANDSLPGTLTTQGLLLVMQPGSKQYRLVAAGGNVADQLDLYVRNSGGGFSFQQSVAGTRAGDDVNYALAATSTKTAADYYLVFLRGETGAVEATRPQSVRLFPVDTTLATSLKVRLHLVRQLRGLNSEADRAAYATAFHGELKAILQSHGVTLDTSTTNVEAGQPPLTVVHNGNVSLPEVPRLADGVNMYMVDSISGGGEGSVVIGFAPREALDLGTNPESRIVLNVMGSSGSVEQRARAMAVTAAHELGHFLGLRHTSATSMDREYDDDDSNRDDGFASTPFCAGLEKRSVVDAQRITTRRADGQAYCLRVTGTAFTCSCPDASNLMYPYKCPEVTQTTLGADQQRVMRNNLKVYQ